MDSNKNQLNQISHSTNLAVEDLIADSQIQADLAESQQKDLPHLTSSTFSIMDQNIASSEKFKSTHNENFKNVVLTRMKDESKIFGKIKDLVMETNDMHAKNFSNGNLLRNEDIEFSNGKNIQNVGEFENENMMIMQTSFARLDISSKEDLKIVEDTRISSEAQSKKDDGVLGSSLVQTSAPSMSECFEGSSPVIFFESLTPEPALAEDTWSISLEDQPFSNEERESTPSPRIIFKEKKKIFVNRQKFDIGSCISPSSPLSFPSYWGDNEMTHLNLDNSTTLEEIGKIPEKVSTYL
jgi:hypothetical protein